MASATQWPSTYVARLRGDIIVAHGRAVPFGLVKPCIITGTLTVPVDFVVQGLSVPISWGSPPISTS